MSVHETRQTGTMVVSQDNDDIELSNDTVTESQLEGGGYPQLSKTRSALLIGTVSAAGLLTVFNVQSVVIVLPSIATALNIPASRQQMVVSMYNVSLAGLMLFWGRLADVYGHHPVFLIGLGLFTLSNICQPFATYEVAFYILRLLQGVSGAAMIPAGLGIVTTTFSPGKARKRAYVIIVAVASTGSILGNLAGGIIGGFLSWKWVFWIPGIIATFVTVAAFVVMSVPHIRRRKEASAGANGDDFRSRAQLVDWLGAAMISSSLLFLLVALTETDSIGWGTAWVPPLIVVAVLLLLLFVWWQYHLEKHGTGVPLLRVSMFRNSRFSALFVLVGFFYAAFSNFLVFATYLYQDYLRLSELHTTLRFLPAGISGVLVSFAVLPALSRIPSFYILMFGLLCALVPPLLFAIPAIPPSTSYWVYGFPAMCLCCSVEIVWPVISLLVADALPLKDQALGGGLLQTANNVGRALGLAIATAVQTSVQEDRGRGEQGLLDGLRAAEWVNVGLVVGSVVIALVFFRHLAEQPSS